ncbi:MAG: RNA ligase, DRB0094 family [Parcubacteria group bacterium LiPW_30]|nr:MAG: RNA ligase, DRB0094 family [Parcubacteria group bacterium LiPW_30]
MKEKLATIREVLKIEAIKNADHIEVAKGDNWKVVVRKGDFKQGALGVFFESGSFLPMHKRYKKYPFLRKSCYTTMPDGTSGFIVKEVRLRKQTSPGLFLPLELFSKIKDPKLGQDVTELLGVREYIRPNFPCLSPLGKKKRKLLFFPRTKQVHIYDLPLYTYFESLKEVEFEESEKIDGTSVTYYYRNGEFGVCSRNNEWEESEKNTLGSSLFCVSDFKGSSLFRVGDFKKPVKLIRKLKDATQESDPVSLHLMSKLSEKFQNQVNAYRGREALPEDFLDALVREFNCLLEKPLYQQNILASVNLSKETQRRLSPNDIKGEDLLKLNRLLLEDTYPLEIAKCDFREPAKLIRKLKIAREVSDPVSFWIKERLPQEIRQQIDSYRDGESVAPKFLADLVSAFNGLLKVPFYDENVFKKVEISKEVQELLAQKNLEGEKLITLNRLLLEDSYPYEIAKCHTLWKVAKQYEIRETLEKSRRNIALRGELVGEGINGNPLRLTGHHFYIFDI